MDTPIVDRRRTARSTQELGDQRAELERLWTGLHHAEEAKDQHSAASDQSTVPPARTPTAA